MMKKNETVFVATSSPSSQKPQEGSGAQAEAEVHANFASNPGDISKENTARPKREDVSRTAPPPVCAF